ncbi:MAG TPA: hypothetical protein VD928_02500 [Candidatus Paceibacterota bacterium]|nr:hypothetical protein [Candidatus Paceibacterota bacterium]
MSFSAEVFTLVLYGVQQLGVVLGVGAQTVILIVYAIATHDRIIEAKEEQFGRVVHKVLQLGLLCMIASGAIITFMHLSAGEGEIIFSPAFVFKWSLIVGLAVLEIARFNKAFTSYWWEGFAAANWFALFVLHILAPVAVWIDLIVLYIMWLIGFLLCWSSIIYATRKRDAMSARSFSTPASAAIRPSPIIQKIAPSPIKLTPPSIAPKPPPPTAPRVEMPRPLPTVPAALPLKPLQAATPVSAVPPQAAATVPAIADTPVKIALPPNFIPEKPKSASPAVPQKPVTPGEKAPHLDQFASLPALRVMPRTPQDAQKHLEANSIATVL